MHQTIQRSIAFAGVLLLTACTNGGVVMDIDAGTPTEARQVLELYVSPEGRAGFSGRLAETNAEGADGPLPDLQAARDAIRRLKRQDALPEGGVVVHVASGRWLMEGPLVLDELDSGTAEAPILYRGSGRSLTRLVGGRPIEKFEPVTNPSVRERLPEAARHRVVVADLRAAGVNDFGTYAPRGHGGGSTIAAAELFVDGEPMTVARWPNDTGLPNQGFVEIADVNGEQLIYAGDRPSRWQWPAPIFLHGYFSLDWASNIVRVASLDTESRAMTLDPVKTGHYGMRAGGRYFYFNVLEELDRPGEYWIDRQTGRLYLWPPSPPEQIEALVSTVTEPLLELRGASHVRIEHMTLEAMRGDAVRIEGGEGVTLAGCTLTNVGRDGVRIEGGRHHTVRACDIHQTGEHGVYVDAGDRATLTPSGHRIHNNHIHHVAREGWTYFPAVHTSRASCGVTITHNRMHDHRHSLVFFFGNDHRIAHNELYNATLESEDAGTFMIGRDFTFQGNVIEGNWIHHSDSIQRTEWGTSGIFLDDAAGGVRVQDNVFQHVDKAVLAGGGVNTHILGNVFIDCEPSVWADERAVSARADRGETMIHGVMKRWFYELNAHEPPFAEVYAHMDAIHEALQAGTGIPPVGLRIEGNWISAGTGAWLATHWATIPDYVTVADNTAGVPVDAFVDVDFGDFAIDPEARGAHGLPAGERPVTGGPVGLVRDGDRTWIEDVRAAIDVEQRPGGDGTPGRAALVLDNRGDGAVSGTELIQIRTRRHGAAADAVAVDYAVEPGETRAFKFDFALTPPQLEGVYDLWLRSRGRGVRPAVKRVAVAYEIEAGLIEIEPVVDGAEPRAGRLALSVSSVAEEAVRRRIELSVAPEGAALLSEGAQLDVALAPGASRTMPVTVALRPQRDGPIGRLQVRAAGESVKPAEQTLIVEHPLARLPADLAVDEVGAALADAHVYPLARGVRWSRGTHIAELRIGVVGTKLAIAGLVLDQHVQVTEMLWDGSCVEVFGAVPDVERIGRVFGNVQVGQVYLVPATDDAPARGQVVRDGNLITEQGIAVRTEPATEGYRIEALVPLEFIGVPPDADRFLFELQATDGTGTRRGNLFGSEGAYRDPGAFGMAVVE